MIETIHNQMSISVYDSDGKRVPPPLPPRLFKFMERKYARALYQRGKFRVGTLYWYQDAEKHGDGVLDHGEGTMEHMEEADSDGTAAMTLTPFSQTVIPGGIPKGVRVYDMKIRTHHQEPDTYVYCLSLSPSWDNDINREYDACVEIFDVQAFVGLMHSKLDECELVVPGVQCDRVVYGSRDITTKTVNQTHTGGPTVRLALLKPARYSNQQEFRFIFQPTPRPISYKDIQELRLAATCRWHSNRPQSKA
jgi:hypothetical protein